MSALQYVAWSPKARGSALNVVTYGLLGESGEPDAFFTDATCRRMFKDHMDVMVNRRSVLLLPLRRHMALLSFVWWLVVNESTGTHVSPI